MSFWPRGECPGNVWKWEEVCVIGIWESLAMRFLYLPQGIVYGCWLPSRSSQSWPSTSFLLCEKHSQMAVSQKDWSLLSNPIRRVLLPRHHSPGQLRFFLGPL